MYARDVERVVDAILDRMTDALADGDRVELRGLGAFSSRETRARVSRNPRSGVAVQVPEKTNVHFKPSKTMHARLNRGGIELEDKADRLLSVS
ncbi:HU family DNA-binding protein [Methylobacterium sp. SI9]|uniref:HU family DNA-binding protein n=1 Tax=Methylobacterium guangdongense TaxID=3138811 RepID=UPI00313E60C9